MFRDGKGNLWTEGGKWLRSGNTSALTLARGLVLALLSIAALLAAIKAFE